MGHDTNHLAASNFILEQPQRRIADAHACDDGRADDFAAIGLQIAFYLDDAYGAFRVDGSRIGTETPGISHGGFGVDDAIVPHELLRRLGRLDPFGQPTQVVSMGYQLASRHTDWPRNQATIRQFADAYCHVDAALHQIDKTIVEPYVDFYFRVLGQKGLNQRQQLQTAKPHRSGNTQPTPQ